MKISFLFSDESCIYCQDSEEIITCSSESVETRVWYLEVQVLEEQNSYCFLGTKNKRC